MPPGWDPTTASTVLWLWSLPFCLFTLMFSQAAFFFPKNGGWRCPFWIFACGSVCLWSLSWKGSLPSFLQNFTDLVLLFRNVFILDVAVRKPESRLDLPTYLKQPQTTSEICTSLRGMCAVDLFLLSPLGLCWSVDSSIPLLQVSVFCYIFTCFLFCVILQKNRSWIAFPWSLVCVIEPPSDGSQFPTVLLLLAQPLFPEAFDPGFPLFSLVS